MTPDLSASNAGAERKSERVKDAIRASIQAGELNVGDQLPSEPALVEQFGVSRSTVREAVTSLVTEGLVSRLHGKGTFVADRPVMHRTIAVVMPYLFVSPNSPLRAGTEVVPSLTQAIEAECRRRGMSIMLFLNNNDPRIERENLRKLPERSVDAAIVNYSGDKGNVDCLRAVQQAGLPLVAIDVRADDVDCTSVGTNNALGAYQATREIWEAGARRVVYITPPVNNSALADRRAGYLDAMGQMGLYPNVLTLEQDSAGPADEEETAHALGVRLLSQSAGPNGILTADAVILSGVWRAAQTLGLRPEQYVLACFDDPALNICEGTRVIKVVQPLQEIGRLSVEIIEEELSGRRDRHTECRKLELAPRIEYVGIAQCAQSTTIG